MNNLLAKRTREQNWTIRGLKGLIALMKNNIKHFNPTVQEHMYKTIILMELDIEFIKYTHTKEREHIKNIIPVLEKDNGTT